jgi:SAM-dependent methyltransferase
MFLAERKEPGPFYEEMAVRTVEDFPFPLAGAHVLDLGCGPGYYGRALEAAGAGVAAVDLDAHSLGAPVPGAPAALRADAARLPFGDAAFDGVFCSNLLEHTPDPGAVVDEVARVLRPGGWGWLSWTNWYSPWGGHGISPFHYLGPRAGVALHRRLRGRLPEVNLPFDGLWPTHIGTVLALVRRHPEVELLDAAPRYYPSQRWLMKVPGLREVAAWNCLLLLRRRP